MRNLKNLALFVLMLALVSTAAVADIHYVNPGESIQAAIDAADHGDQIEVAPGFYPEVINFNGKAIRLYSTGGPDMTTIHGGGAYHVVYCASHEGPDTVLEGFTITGGNATGLEPHSDGGGMYNWESSPTVTNCTFSSNTANYHGGGMYNDNSSPTVTNCTFTGNSANSGGGMYNNESSPTVTNCTFTGNNADWYGGGMNNYNNSSPTVTNCTFGGNTANLGGGMYNFSSSPTVTNCTFSGNISHFYGGGMSNVDYSSPTVTNCILWGDSPDEIFDDDNSSTTVTYSDVQGGWPGTGNIDADPLFADGDLRLSAASPCINAGSNAALPPDTADLDGDGDTTEPIPLDLDGNARIFNGVVDMGAYELQTLPEVTFSGWVWMESGGDFGYSSDEDDLLYFLSFGPVWYYNPATKQWGEEGPVGWTYVNWPYLYELDTSTKMFALPPADGLWVYHFRPSQWTVSPQIIPW
ncbi:MAG: right-handed parallel beta-helix repeat-containing protein [Planctomycetota bacterium]|jgi:hypothetical protein